MKLGSIDLTDISTVPQLDRSNVNFLWFNEFYDSPLSGIAEVNGTRYLFDIVDRNVLGNEEEVRRYWLIELSDAQMKEEVQWHELFCCKVGTHFDLTNRDPLPRESVDLDAFYVPYRNRVPPDYSNNDVVGWFRL